jgi:hypothetical protein
MTNRTRNMKTAKLVQIAGLLAAMVMGGMGAAVAQTAPPSHSLKTIGTPTTAKPEIVPSLFVLNSRGATLQGDTLRSTQISSDEQRIIQHARAKASD